MTIKNPPSKGEIIIYRPKNGLVDLNVRLEDETIWLALDQIALLFGIDKSGTSRHINNIFNTGELDKDSTVAKIATVQKEGKRQAKRIIEFYNLDMIISIGYRVNSKRATEFRIWATQVLKKYIVDGFVVNKKRLQDKEIKLHELEKTICFLKNVIDTFHVSLSRIIPLPILI